jgi:predicted ATP-binding protein involved in virulence
MRVFAGPNGSGKSTIINAVRNVKVGNQLVDFGIYVNADDIARELRNGTFNFKKFKITVTNDELRQEAFASGLINSDFTKEQFISAYSFDDNTVNLIQQPDVLKPDERIAQILAEKKHWDKIDKKNVPEWFKKYYSAKVLAARSKKKTI